MVEGCLLLLLLLSKSSGGARAKPGLKWPPDVRHDCPCEEVHTHMHTLMLIAGAAERAPLFASLMDGERARHFLFGVPWPGQAYRVGCGEICRFREHSGSQDGHHQRQTV